MCGKVMDVFTQNAAGESIAGMDPTPEISQNPEISGVDQNRIESNSSVSKPGNPKVDRVESDSSVSPPSSLERPDVSGIKAVSSVDSALPPKKQNVDRFIGVFSILLAVLFFVLQANGIGMNWQSSLIGYSSVAVVGIWSCLRHAVPHLGRNRRYLWAF